MKLGRTLEFEQTIALLADSRQFVFMPLEVEHVLEFEIDASIPEMHDRIIVGVARRAGAQLISRDGAIIGANVPVIW